MPALNSCARCGAEMRTQNSEGFCTRCLLERGLEESMEESKVSGPGQAQSPLTESTQRTASIEPGTVRRFGDYEVLEEIARGGMGVVYRARQPNLERIVALKMILAGQFASEQIIKRFRGEVTAAALLQHPNIVVIHDVGIHDGQHYFSMDYVEGQNLSQLVGNRPLPPASAARYVQLIAEAIHYAHGQGILHRDLKPSNVLVDSATDQPRLTDFGLAKRLDGESSLTVTGQVLGSPNFMPPEQAGGGHGKVGRHSDVYGLGAILYYLLTARPPFQAGSLEGIVTQVLQSEPLAPRALNPSVPRDLETICLKCLTKEPHKRYATAGELAEELGRFLRDEPIQARPLAKVERFWRWCRRNPKTAILSTAVIFLLITVATGSTLAAIRIKRAERAVTEELFDTFLAKAHAVSRSSREGQRVESLEAVVKATAIRSSTEVRSEAIASLATTDVRFSGNQMSSGQEGEIWDSRFVKRAYIGNNARLIVRRIADNSEVALSPSLGTGLQSLYAISPGGRYVVVKVHGRPNEVWDIQENRPILTNSLGCVSAEFGEDGQSLIASCGDGTLLRFHLSPVQTLPSLPLGRRYHVLRLRPQGDWFAGYEEGHRDVEVRDLQDGSLLKTFSHLAQVGSMAWDADGRTLAVGCASGRVFLWNAESSEKKNEFKAHQDTVVALGFSHAGGLLGSFSWNDEFRLWDLTAERLVLTALGQSYQLLFSPDDRRIGYIQRGRETGSLEVMASSIFHRLNSQTPPDRGSFGMDVSPDGRLIAATFAGGVRIWADQQTDNPFLLLVGPCYSAIFTPDGTNLITCGPSGLALWPLQRISGSTTDELHIGPRQTIQDGFVFNYAALSKDGRWVAAAHPDAQELVVYEVRHPTNHFPLRSQPRIQWPSISPNRRWVAAGNFKTSGVKVWEFESQEVVGDITTSSSALATFSPDNRWLAVGGESYDLLETGTWKRKYSIRRARPEAEIAMAFSPDARMLAIVVETGIVRLVAAETGDLLANLEAPGAGLIVWLCFSPDGSRLYALEWGDKQVQVWDLHRLRTELRKLKLDWSAAPIPVETASAMPVAKPLRIFLDDHLR